MAQQLRLGQQGNVDAPVPGRGGIFLREHAVAQRLGLLHNQLPGALRHGAPVVENFRNGVAAQTAGVGNVLNGDSFERHERLSFLWAVCSIYYSMRAMKNQDVQNVNRCKTGRTTHSVS